MNAVSTRRVPTGGFTLVELMVVIAVAAILTIIAVPSLRVFVMNVRRDSVIDGLVASLHYARNQALDMDQTAFICAGANSSTGTGTTITTACATGSTWNNGWAVVTAPAGASTPTLLATHALAAVVSAPTLTAVNGNTAISFNSLGLATFSSSTSEVFVVCDARGASMARAVEVNATGYIQSSPTPGLQPNGVTALTCPGP